jgi:hypothetical protein
VIGSENKIEIILATSAPTQMKTKILRKMPTGAQVL